MRLSAVFATLRGIRPPAIFLSVFLPVVPVLFAGVFAGGWFSSLAHATPLQAGVDYDVVTPPVAPIVKEPEVVEIFNFKCSHCYALSPHLTAWVAQNSTRYSYRSFPIFWGKQKDVPARAFFTAEYMGHGEAMKRAIFKAHFDHTADIEHIEEITFLAEAVGLDAEAFRGYMHLPGVDAKLKQAKNLQRAYRTTSTPTLIINGRYRLQPGKHAMGEGNKVDYARLFYLIETLAAQ